MKSEDIDDSSAPLIEHLAELRKRLIWSALAFVAALGPGIAAAACGAKHVSAQNCVTGQVWDDAASRCVTPAG